MKIERFLKRDIVREQIEIALQLFAGGTALFSAITLAGAAEEELGHLLKLKAGQRVGSMLGILHPLSEKRGEDDWLQTEESAEEIHTDPYQEALFLLGRAIDDYQSLTGTLTAPMQQFNGKLRGK